MAALRISQDLLAVRRWILGRGGWPCRRLDGRLAIGFHGDICRGISIGWDEFEVLFRMGRYALAYDDEVGVTRCFLGELADARHFVEQAAGLRALAS